MRMRQRELQSLKSAEDLLDWLNKDRRRTMATLYSMLIPAILGVLITGAFAANGDPDNGLQYGILLGLVVAYIAILQRYSGANPRRAKQVLKLIDTLSRTRNDEVIPVLIECLGSLDKEVKAAGHRGIVRLLTAQAGQELTAISDRHRASLRDYALDPKLSRLSRDSFRRPDRKHKGRYIHKGKPLALVVLEWLTVIGTESDIPAVRRIAEEDHPFRKDPDVVECARRCLAEIKSRDEANIIAGTLLRASDGASVDSDRLLKPAQSDGREAEALRAIE